MNHEDRTTLLSIRPVGLQEYLRSRGWVLKEDLSARAIALYERGGLVVDVPLNPDYADYARRVGEVIEAVAQLERVSARTLVDDLTQPVGDVLAVRVHSDATASGTIPLEESIRIRQAARTLLLAAAHSADSPQAFFPRLSRSNAVALVSSVHEGQTHRGSLVARFIVPVEPAVGQTSLLDEPEPYGRRVVRLLLQAVDAVRRVRALGAYDPLLSMAKEGVSGNLLTALGSMSPPGESGSLELSVAWARNRKPPAQGVSRVHFEREALAGLHAVGEAMKSQAKTPGFEVVGYVTRLSREQLPETPGEIVLVPTESDATGINRLSVRLDAATYQEAIKAHQEGLTVRVIGTLQRLGRRWTLGEPTGFELVSGSAADGDG